MVAAIWAGIILLANLAGAELGDAYLGDLVSADVSPFNFGVYNRTKGGYGSASFSDYGDTIGWEVDIFQTSVIPTSIELALATQGLPKLFDLTDAENPPSPDGVSFGEFQISDLEQAIASSIYPAASLKDGTILVVAKFSKPPNSALIASISDGSTITHMVYAPPSPPTSTPPAPDMYALHPGVEPDIFYAQLDGTQVYILESGIVNPSNGTVTMLLYDWKDGTYTWEADVNGLNNPTGLSLRVFVDLKEQPLLFNIIPDQPWSPDTVLYTGNFTKSQLTAALAAVNRSDVSINDDTPKLFFEIIDGAVGSTDSGSEAPPTEESDNATSSPPPPPQKPGGSKAPAPPSPPAKKPQGNGTPAPPPPAKKPQGNGTPAPPPPAKKPQGNGTPAPPPPAKKPQGSNNSASGAPPAKARQGSTAPVTAAPPRKPQGTKAPVPAPPGKTPGGLEPSAKDRRRQLLGEALVAPEPPGPSDTVDTTTSVNGTCGIQEPSRLIGFIFDSNSRWKLKPVLKDTSSLPEMVKNIPLYISAGILGVCGIVFIAFYIAGTLDASS